MTNNQQPTDNMNQINLVPDNAAREYLLAARAAYPGSISNRALALGVVHAAMRNIPVEKLWGPSDEVTPPPTVVDTVRSGPNGLSMVAAGLTILNLLVLAWAFWLYHSVTNQIQDCAVRQQAQEARMVTLENHAQEQEAAIIGTMDAVSKLRGKK